MKTIILDGLQIHSNTGNVDFWVHPGIEGLDVPETRMTEYDRPGEDGGTVSSMLYGSRPIVMEGTVKGNDVTAYEANRRLLSQACIIERDRYNYPVSKTLQITTLNNVTYTLQVYVKKLSMAMDNVKSCKFMLQLVAADPFIYDSSSISTGAIARPSGGGFVLPVILPIVFAAAVGGTGVVINNGTAPASPVITLTGPATNPFIINTTTGDVFQLNYTIPSGSTVVIDMNITKKTIIMNGSTNLLYTKSTDSVWWSIPVGSNTINYSTGSSGDTGTMTLSFTPRYAGI